MTASDIPIKNIENLSERAIPPLTAETGDAHVVEQDHWPHFRKTVRYKQIPVVLPATEMAREDERRTRFYTEVSLRVTNSIGLNETRGAVPGRRVDRPRIHRSGCPAN